MTLHLAQKPLPEGPAGHLSRTRGGITALNARYRDAPARDVLAGALRDRGTGQVAMVSSFGAESAVLLHIVASVDPSLPVLFVDTLMLFPETLDYQRALTRQLGLSDVRTVRAGRAALDRRDPYGALRVSDSDACCALRKAEPLERALSGFDSWVTGRKRFQNTSRARLDLFEHDAPTGRIKINPLAHWGPDDLRAYMDRHDLPRHPLMAHGYPSIGCAPCTFKVRPGEDPRAGRWRGQDKEECGIHFVGGRAKRQGESA